MYGNDNSKAILTKFKIRDNQEKIKRQQSSNRNTLSKSLMLRRNNNTPTNNTPSPTEVAYQIYSAIHKERINARTTK